MNSAEDTRWTLVVAMSPTGVIGHEGDLPWRLSSDLKRFKKLTMGQCLLMGSNTYRSIGRPLPGRQTIVLSRSGGGEFAEQVDVVEDLSQVAAAVDPGRQIMVVGGAQVYAAALPYCNQIFRTLVKATVEGDVYFPTIDWQAWQLLSSESTPAGPRDDWPTEYQEWQRKSS